VLVTHDIEEAAQLADRVLVLSERPARVRDEIVLDVPRPRDLTHPEVVAAVHRILTVLGIESEDADTNAGRFVETAQQAAGGGQRAASGRKE
jgi:ABC-type nitrate/sulfonate/bicarbonate transport system ATPase subunit